jgi:hypothetical protein
MEMMEASVMEMSAMPPATTAVPAAPTAVHPGVCHPNAANQQ